MSYISEYFPVKNYDYFENNLSVSPPKGTVAGKKTQQQTNKKPQQK